MSDPVLDSIRDCIQQDPGNRGLARIPGDNLLTACPDDFANACAETVCDDDDIFGRLFVQVIWMHNQKTDALQIGRLLR